MQRSLTMPIFSALLVACLACLLPGPAPAWADKPSIGLIDAGSYIDAKTRLERLGYRVTVIPQETDLETLRAYDVVFLADSWAAGHAYGVLETHAADFLAYVGAGGGLYVEQPNPINEPGQQATPSLLPLPITFSAAYDDADYPPEVVDPDHLITTGLKPEELPFPADQMTTVDPGYEVLVRGGSTRTPSLAVLEQGSGRVVVQTDSCLTSMAYPISNAALTRMVNWAAGVDKATLEATAWTVTAYQFDSHGAYQGVDMMIAWFYDGILHAANRETAFEAPFTETVDLESHRFTAVYEGHDYMVYVMGQLGDDGLAGIIYDTRGPYSIFTAEQVQPMEPRRQFHALPPDVTSTGGMATDGMYLYVSSPDTREIIQVDPDTETVVARLPWTLSDRPAGLAYDGAYYYVTDGLTNNVFVLDKNFAFIRKFNGPETTQRGVCFDDAGNLLIASGDTDTIWKVDPVSGDAKGSIDMDGRFMNQPEALAFDGEQLWHTNTMVGETNLLYHMDLSGMIQDTFAMPGHITGLAMDGAFLWGVDGLTGDLYEFPAAEPTPAWADIWAEPNPATIGQPVDVLCNFHNEDPILAEPFTGVFGLGIMFEGQWEFHSIYFIPLYLPAMSTYTEIPVLHLDSYPSLPSWYFVDVLLDADLQLVSYDWEDMDDASVAMPRKQVDAKIKAGLERFRRRLAK